MLGIGDIVDYHGLAGMLAVTRTLFLRTRLTSVPGGWIQAKGSIRVGGGRGH